MGIPPIKLYTIPTHDVARMVSMGPMLLFVAFPYTAPNVSVGAMTEMNSSMLTATVF